MRNLRIHADAHVNAVRKLLESMPHSPISTPGDTSSRYTFPYAHPANRYSLVSHSRLVRYYSPSYSGIV